MFCLLKIKNFHWHQNSHMLWPFTRPCSSIKDYPRKLWPIFAKKEPISNSVSALNGLSDLQSAAQAWVQICVLNRWLCASRWIPQITITILLVLVGFLILTCTWMSGASGLGNQTTHMMVVELASFCLCIDFYVHPQVNPLSSFEMNILSKFININIHRCTHRCIPTWWKGIWSW